MIKLCLPVNNLLDKYQVQNETSKSKHKNWSRLIFWDFTSGKIALKQICQLNILTKRSPLLIRIFLWQGFAPANPAYMHPWQKVQGSTARRTAVYMEYMRIYFGLPALRPPGHQSCSKSFLMILWARSFCTGCTVCRFCRSKNRWRRRSGTRMCRLRT